MRVGSLNTAPDLCGCNLCLVLARIGSICHTGELPIGAVSFATDRLRVVYGELLDIRTRELLSPPLSGGNQGTPPVAAGGEPQAAAPPQEAGSEGVVAPELPPEAPVTGRVKKEEGGEKKDNQAAGESQALLDENAPKGEKEAPESSPAPPREEAEGEAAPAGPSWPISTEKEAPQASSKATGLKNTPPLVKAVPKVPVKAAPRRPLHLSPPPPPAAAKTETEDKEEDEYTYESPEEEELEEDFIEEEAAEPASSRPSPEARTSLDKREPLRRAEKRPRSRSHHRERTEEKKQKRDRSRKRQKSRSRSRRRERRSSRERREEGRRDLRRPSSPVGPPPEAHYAAKGGGKGKQKGRRVKKSKGVKREARWQDIQQFGPSKTRKRRREDKDRRGAGGDR